MGQSGNLTPADKKLYALRDVTATVNSIPLITSSIMSKKLAAGAHNIVLDVKVGSGAFMKTPADGRALAEKMVSIGKLCGRNMTAVLTNMDVPLGHNIGNALEVREAVAVLKGESRGDLREVCIALASNLIRMVFDLTEEEARRRVIDALGSGAAFSKLKEWISAQGGDTRCLDDPSLFPATAFAYEIQSPVNGYIRKMDAERIGITSVMLGAGRETKDAPIDYSAGIVLCKKVGERVSAGETLATLYTNRESALAEAAEHYLTALTFGETPPEPQPLIYEIVR